MILVSMRISAAVVLLPVVFLAASVRAGPKEDTQEAERIYHTGDVVTAIGLFRRAADAGEPLAQARLGEILDAAEDDAAAVEWFKRSAAQGHAAGEYGLGQMYAKGEGVAKDQAEALRLYRLAADKDYVHAVQAIAWAYFRGDLGLARDPAQAQTWGARAEKLGGHMPKPDRSQAEHAPAKGPSTKGPASAGATK